MTWEDEIVRKVIEGYKETGTVPNMVCLLVRDGKTDMLPLVPTSETLALINYAQQAVKEHITEIQEVALVVRAVESHFGKDAVQVGKNQESLMIVFETRNGISVRRFWVEGGELKEREHVEGNVEMPFGFGLYVKPLDLGRMYG